MWMRSVGRISLIAAASTIALAACGQRATERAPIEPEAPAAEAPAAAQAAADPQSATMDQRFPDVIAAEARRSGSDALRFDVTISSPYDSPQRYADAWRVLGADGTVYGVRELLHDHASEQPFRRSLDGVEIPDGVDQVTIEARDLVNGWGGTTVDISVPPREP